MKTWYLPEFYYPGGLYLICLPTIPHVGGVWLSKLGGTASKKGDTYIRSLNKFTTQRATYLTLKLFVHVHTHEPNFFTYKMFICYRLPLYR